jgi:hypothetical protein
MLCCRAGGWPTCAAPQTRLPHPSRFSKGEHHGRWHQATFLTPSLSEGWESTVACSAGLAPPIAATLLHNSK